MQDFIAWLTTSSADPEKTAATVKGVIMLVIPFLAMVLGINQDLANSLAGSVVNLVSLLLTLVGTIVTIYGVSRKIRLGQWSHPDA